MKKTLSNYEIEYIFNKLNVPDNFLRTTDDNKKLPIKILWKIYNNLEALEKIFAKIDKEKMNINDSYSTDEKSSFVVNEETGETLRQVKQEYLEQYKKDVNELMGIENELIIDTIPLSWIENINMLPSDFESIRFMIEDDNAIEDGGE